MGSLHLSIAFVENNGLFLRIFSIDYAEPNLLLVLKSLSFAINNFQSIVYLLPLVVLALHPDLLHPLRSQKLISTIL